MKITPRDYQQAAHDAIFAPWIAGEKDTGNPACELATGLGKSILVAMCCMTIRERWPKARVAMLVHNRELVQQNYEELKELWPEAPVGIYSAGLNRRDTEEPIIFGSIQSLYNKADVIGPRHFNLCDECHLIPSQGSGMYQTYFQEMRILTNNRMRAIGFTATPYRTDSGDIADQRDGDKLFDNLAYSFGIGEGTRQGWLSPLTARMGDGQINIDGVRRRGGDLAQNELRQVAEDDSLVLRAVRDLIARARAEDRKSWVAFCSGVTHSEMVAEALRLEGVTAAAVTGKTPKHERDHLLDEFKRGRITCLTNAEVLTTGFNAPGIDLIAMLRPTLSTSLYIQMMGRGTRVLKSVKINEPGLTAEERCALIAQSEKPNCLVLDYAGNVKRHGCVDLVEAEVQERREAGPACGPIGRVGHNDVRAKECPECATLNQPAAVFCVWPGCDHQFKEVAKHEDTPDEDIAVLSDEVEAVSYPVQDWEFKEHWSKNAMENNGPPVLEVTYQAGFQQYREYLCFEHRGRPRHKATMWWARHSRGSQTPATVGEAHDRQEELIMPIEITPVKEGKWWRIQRRKFDPADFEGSPPNNPAWDERTPSFKA